MNPADVPNSPVHVRRVRLTVADVETRPGSGRGLGAHWDGAGTNFAVFSSAGAYGGAVELCLVRAPTATARCASRWPSTRTSGRSTCRGVGPGQRYGYRASRPVGARARPALRRRRGCSTDPYALALEPVGGDRPREQHSLVVDEAFDWGDDAPPARPVVGDGALRDARPGDQRRRIPTCPTACAGPTPGWAASRSSTTSSRSASPPSSCCRCTQFVTEQRLLDMGLVNYWGYTTLGFFAPHGPYRSSVAARQPGRRVQDAGQDAARGGPRGHPRRRLQPHVRGRPRRADALLPRPRQRGLLPARPRRPGALRRHDRHVEHAERRPARGPAAHHGLAALLGHRDARRRLPLRPRRDARPRPRLVRPARVVLRPRLPGPGRRRASSSSPSRGTSATTRSAASRAAGRSGTTATATTCATSGAGAAACARWATA